MRVSKKFMKYVLKQRRHQRASVEAAHEQLKDCLDGEFEPGYFNSPKALVAENGGLSVIDAVLGHVIDESPNVEVEARTIELLNRVSRSLVTSEVENRCHNLHAACALMLDALNVPVVIVWGSVYATGKRGRAFWLNAVTPPSFPGHRPGHSWLLTPSWRVADLSLVHQYGVIGDYGKVQPTLPRVITVTSSEASEPARNWWRTSVGSRLTAEQYIHETRYYDVIGWSQYKSGSTTVRYLPGSVTLPEEVEMGDIDIRIGGLSPREFFDKYASDLVQA